MSKVSRDKGEWRAVPGYDAYEISETGALRRRVRGRTRFAGHVVKGYNSGGYHRYKIMGNDGSKHVTSAHVLVCLTFVGPRPSALHQVAHFDGNPQNNHYRNLRWATAKENIDDRVRHRSLHGERNGRSLLTAGEVALARSKYTGRWGQQSQLAREFGMSASAMRSILLGEHRQYG